MENSKIQKIELNIPKILTISILFVLIAVIPVFIHSQWITGPYINALLITTCVLVWPMEALIFAMIPSSVALASWLLPLPLAPMVPFIIISNALFVTVFYLLNKKNYLLGLLVWSISKFIFLYLIVTFLAQKLINEKLISNVTLMMTWPQLYTAIIGWLLAYWILRIIKWKKTS